jgi:glycosyltransferase involved in cell wall biosynthesis
VLGHRTVHSHLQAFISGRDDANAWFATVPHPGRLGYHAVRHYRSLGSLGMADLRWRLRWSMIARQLLRQRLDRTDAIFVNTQACALLLGGSCRRTNCVISVDATGAQYSRLEYYRPRDRFAPVGERILYEFERRSYERAYRILPWTRWVAQSLREDYDVPDERIVTLHPGAPLHNLRTIPADHAGAPFSPLRAVFIGDDTERKGLPTLLEAVRRLQGEVLLDIVTGSRVPDAPYARVHPGVRTGSFSFLRLLSDADVLVLPTRADAVPWVLIEAMAAGLAIISTGVGAIPEVVGEAGIMVPPGDPETLALHLAGLAGNPEACRERGRKARERAEDCYDAEKQLPRLFEVMLDAAASGRS